MSEENVRVAVRVRPFNSREQERNAMLIVDMQGSTTKLTNPEAPKDEPKKFTFDFSYWSFDGCKKQDDGYMVADTTKPNGSKYCDQRRVFNDLGNGIMDNAWKGFNCSLFAYGQTGSGKSYSVVGYSVNKGLVPMFCEDLFKKINAASGKGDTQYEVSFSMLEIYNEIVRDLLNPTGDKKAGLPVRQHPKMGFYPEGLKEVAVDSYLMIEKKTEEGTANRTIAATNMNATSSRAHTIVSIKFVQKYKNPAGKETAKTSIINLVDLAGSERADSTGATGDRLKEGAAINLSLSSLGNVIAALAENSQGKGTRVPYRDSVLTKLLMNALGGNSRTIMVAAISPADINFDETLSTLRYADRAKQIKCKATVNEDPTEKLIHDLKEENDRLKKLLETGSISKKEAGLNQNMNPEDDDDDDDDEKEGLSEEERVAIRTKLEAEMQAAFKENERQMDEMKRQYEEKLKQAQEETHTTRGQLSETNEKAKKTPHLFNLNIDPLLTGQVKYLLEGSGIKKIGKKKDDKTPDIGLLGPGIYPEHAQISVEGGKFFIEKMTADARVLLNGVPVMKKTEMMHNDRLVIATISYFVFCIPSKASQADQEVTFDMAQQEIAKSSGITLDGSNKSKDELLLQQDLIEIMADIEEANSISSELDKKMKFELVIVSPIARGLHTGRSEAFVRVTNFDTNLEWLWDKMTFISRKEKMEEIYEDIIAKEKTAWLTPQNDPFYESPDAAVLVGTVALYMKSIAYMLPFKDQMQIVDYKGEHIGYMTVELVPCNAAGKPLEPKDCLEVDNPAMDLTGKELHFLVKIANIRGLPRRFEDIHCQYKVYLEDDYTKTEKIMGTNNPDFNHSEQFSFASCSPQLIEHFLNKPILIQVWGEQKHPPAKNTKGMNTTELIASERQAKGQVSTVNSNTKIIDSEKVKLQQTLDLLLQRMKRLEARVECFKHFVDAADENHVDWVSYDVLKKISKANNEEELVECIKKMNKEGKGKKDKSKDDTKKSSVCVLL